MTAIRSAWNTRVAGCVRSPGGAGATRETRPASCRSRRRATSPVGDDGAREAPRGALLAKVEEDIGEFGLARLGQKVRRGLAAPFHPHVERRVLAQREAALGLVELHRGDADVERDAVEVVAVRVEVAEAGLHEFQPVGEFSRERGAAADGGRVAVERDHGCAARQQGAAIAAGAESAVEIEAAGAHV